MRPCIFLCSTHKGNILVFDLSKSSSTPVDNIYASEKPIYSLCFNRSRPDYVASGDSLGVVKIWKLSNILSRKSSDEMKVLNNISERPFDSTEYKDLA